MLIGSSYPSILKRLEQGFVASCQPVDGGAMDHPHIVSAMAQACVQGGAVALRIEGIANLKATRPMVKVPIIGIIKRDLNDSPVRITPYIEDVIALAQAGADIIAFDGTFRTRPTTIEKLLHAIKQHGCLAMADCSNLDEGLTCKQLGVDIIGSTLSGYVGKEVPEQPDLQLVRDLRQAGCFVMAEGRYNSPELARQAIEHGAHSVTIGSAITRIEHICQWFSQAVHSASPFMKEAR